MDLFQIFRNSIGVLKKAQSKAGGGGAFLIMYPDYTLYLVLVADLGAET